MTCSCAVAAHPLVVFRLLITNRTDTTRRGKPKRDRGGPVSPLVIQYINTLLNSAMSIAREVERRFRE